MNVHLQNEPLSRGFLRRREKKFMAVVQHKGEKIYVSCRRQGPLLCFLLQGLHDGSSPDMEVTVPICPFHQKPEPVTLWLFLPLLSSLWKCDFFTIHFVLERVTLSVCPSCSLANSVSSLSLSLPLELASSENCPGSSSLLNPPLALKYDYISCLILISSKCNLKILNKQELYLILPQN